MSKLKLTVSLKLCKTQADTYILRILLIKQFGFYIPTVNLETSRFQINVVYLYNKIIYEIM